MIEVAEEVDDDLDSGWARKIRQGFVYTNVHDQSESCLVDVPRGYLNPRFDFASLKFIFEDKREYAAYCQERVRLAEFIYDPRNVKTFSLDSTGGERLNLYQPPEWKRASYFTDAPLPQASQAAPSLIDRYLDHLCGGDVASKEYILDWLATALTSRNFTILTAIGDPGIGKGKLGEIMSKLVGRSNFAKVRDSVFKAKFNAPLRNKQIVYVDEVAIKTTEEANRIKDVVNQQVEIERKGVDAEEVDNHASFYLTSNQMDAVKIEAGDRRFSIIQLTDKSLLTAFTVPEINELVDDKIVGEFALYLLNRPVKNSMFHPFRSARFDQVLEAGLSEWELWLVEEYFGKMPAGTVTQLDHVQAKLQENFAYMKVPPGRLRIQELVGKFPTKLKFKKNSSTRSIEVL